MIREEKLECQGAYEVCHEALEVDSEANTPWHNMLKQHLRPMDDLIGKRVLEIGCGRGGFACWLMSQPQRPTELVAADYAVTAVQKGQDFAAARGITGIQWETADIQALHFPTASFDTVISCETIEHVPDPGLALAELGRVLKPGGRLYLTTPNYFNGSGLYRIYLRMCSRVYTEEGQPINHCLLLPQTRSWVKRTGLRVIQTDSIRQVLPFPGRPGIELPELNSLKMLMRWMGTQSLIVAEKP